MKKGTCSTFMYNARLFTLFSKLKNICPYSHALLTNLFKIEMQYSQLETQTANIRTHSFSLTIPVYRCCYTGQKIIQI